MLGNKNSTQIKVKGQERLKENVIKDHSVRSIENFIKRITVKND